MRTRQINRASSVVVILLSVIALATVVTGLIWPPPMPEADEGTQAHLSASIAALLPMTIVIVGTGDWRQPWRSMRPLVISVAATVLAFVGLYYLEHFR